MRHLAWRAGDQNRLRGRAARRGAWAAQEVAGGGGRATRTFDVVLELVLLLVVEAHVDHDVDGVGDVAVQVGVAALCRVGVHAAPRGTLPEGVVHLGAEVGRHVLAREVLGEVEHAVAVCVLRKGEGLHQVGVVLGHLRAEVLVGRPVLELEHHLAEGVGAERARPRLHVAGEKVREREPVHRLAVAAVDHLHLLRAEALQKAVRPPALLEARLQLLEDDRLAAPPAALEVGELGGRVGLRAHPDRRAVVAARRPRARRRGGRQPREQHLHVRDERVHLGGRHLDRALVRVLVRRLRRLRLLLVLLHVVAP